MLGATFQDLAKTRPGETKPDIERWPFLVEPSRTSPELPVVTGARITHGNFLLSACLYVCPYQTSSSHACAFYPARTRSRTVLLCPACTPLLRLPEVS